MKSAFLCLALLALAPLARADRPFFAPPPLSTFDGKSWGPLQIGKTTFKEIRPLFETGEGFLPSSTELSQPKNSPMRVDCLWRKEDGREVLGAISIQIKGLGAAQSDVLRAFAGGDATTENGQETLPAGVEALYQPGRFEQWRVLRFPSRGVAAFQVKIGDTTQTPMLLFASKDGIGTLSETLSTEYSTPVERVDPHANKPKIAGFGNVSASLDVEAERGLGRSQRREIERRFTNRIQAASAGGTLEHHYNASGSYNLEFDVNKSGRGGSVTAKATISASGPYGPISATGSGYESWKRDGDRDEWVGVGGAIEDAGLAAMRAAENDFANKMRASGPPPVSVVRWKTWEDLVNTTRNFSGLAPIRF